MPKAFDQSLSYEIAKLTQSGLLRQIHPVASCCDSQIAIGQSNYLNFASNDYLGLAKHPEIAKAAQNSLAKWGVGSGASHLVSGHTLLHQQLAEHLAEFTGFADCLTFSTGYMANLAVIPTLADRQTSIFADKLNHASLIDAVQLAQSHGAISHRYRHLDYQHLHSLLASSTSQKKIIVSDAVFSMDGDCADLIELYRLAQEFSAWLVIDDAHGFGIFAKQGQGSIAKFALPSASPLILMATCGKALGVSGAFVVASAQVISYLRQKARSYIYTTATPAMIAAATLQSLAIIKQADDLREHLWALITKLKESLAHLPFALMPSDTPIQPLLIGDVDKCNFIADSLWQQQIWVPAIRPPTVAAGQARLRISLSASHSIADIERLAAALSAIS